MKTIILNGSPRKDWNTALLLKSAKEGAEAAGAETEFIDLFDLKYAGCRSCLACKRKGVPEPCRCYYQDELTPVLERVWQADRLILGSPIYFGEPTGQIRNFLERVIFPALSYNSFSTVFQGKVDVDVFLTMNAPEEAYEKLYRVKMEEYFEPFRLLRGDIRIHPVWDTVQVRDYSKFEMAGIDGAKKQARHDALFPDALSQAFEIGKKN